MTNEEPKEITLAELMDLALQCKTKEEADALIEKILEQVGNPLNLLEEERRAVLLGNIGYIAGYYGPKEVLHIQNLFGAIHPVFGKADEDGRWPYTQEEIFQMGLKMGEEMKKKYE